MAAAVRVYISIGSNVDRERYVTAALDALSAWFGELIISPVYDSEAVGFDGSPFLNLVVGVDTTLPVAELSQRFKQLEAENGRRRDVPKFSARTLDLDILTYGDAVGRIEGVELPRGEILKNAFVLNPMASCGGNTALARSFGRWISAGRGGRSQVPPAERNRSIR